MNGYLDAISEQSISITLAGCCLDLPRARLGLHLHLGRIADDFDQAPGSSEMASLIERYFEALGVDTAGASVVEILTAFISLRTANAWLWALPFMKDEKPPGDPEAYDYEGRNWAWVIHKLASRYGWTRDTIMDLYPEEAGVYLQEILISDHFEAEERYRLSELAYHYDKTTGKSNYQPLSKPGWMVSQELPKPVRMLRAMLPFGVKNLEGQEITYH